MSKYRPASVRQHLRDLAGRRNKEEPPHVLRRKLLTGLSIHRQRRSDFHKANLLDAFAKIETQAMGDASTAIVGSHEEVLVPKMTHRLDLVQCHCSERVIEMVISVNALLPQTLRLSPHKYALWAPQAGSLDLRARTQP